MCVSGWGLGSWKYIVQIIGIFGVLSNAAILTFTMDWFGYHFDLSADNKIWAFFILEHILFATYGAIALLIPDQSADYRSCCFQYFVP